MLSRLLLLTILLTLQCTTAFSQFRGSGNKMLGVDVFKGFIFEHKPQIAHLITDHPIGFRITLDRRSYGASAWEERYNFPDAGMTFTYVDYRNKSLGKTLSLIPHFNFYITRNKRSKNQFKYKTGIGIAYNTEKYDRVYNNKNNVLSTAISIGVLFELAYQRKISERLFLNTHLSFTHFSNGAIKKPNSGINVVSSNVGLSYLIRYTPTHYDFDHPEFSDEIGLGYTVALASGIHEYSSIGTGQRPFFVLSALADKRINYKSAFGIGLEWFASLALKNDISGQMRHSFEHEPDWHRIGLALSHELFINKLSIITQAGYYLHDELNYYGKIYFRVGLRKYFNDKIYGSFSIKSHAARAEAAEFGLGWRIQ